MNASDVSRLKSHIHDLEQQVQIAKTLLRRAEVQTSNSSSTQSNHHQHPYSNTPVTLTLSPSLHNLLLLSDSALPLGSFAYSSGLESYLAHHKPIPNNTTLLALFHKFLNLSIQSLTFSTVPYMLASFRDPLGLAELDNDLDASTPCTVQRRASIAQGKALVSIWEKALSTTTTTTTSSSSSPEHENLESITALQTFATDLREAAINQEHLPGSNRVNGHLAPIWGVVTRSLGLNLDEAAYLFLLNHVKAVLSAAVRASVMGPYMAQSVLASRGLQHTISACLEKVWFVQPEDAGQVVPVMDLWIGRHEMLYSRIFNS